MAQIIRQVNNMYTIGKFSELTGISVSTLRYYDQIGLIVPEIKRDNNYRYYSNDQLLHSQFVSNMKNVGLPLESIVELKKMKSPEEVLKRISEVRRRLMGDLALINSMEEYYANGILNRSNNLISEDTIEFGYLEGSEVISMEIKNNDPERVFALECQMLQKKRNDLGLIQMSGMRIIYNVYNSDKSNRLLMPVRSPKTDASKAETEVMDMVKTASCVIGKETIEYRHEIDTLIGILKDKGMTPKGTPIIECLLDPGDIPDMKRVVAKIHILI